MSQAEEREGATTRLVALLRDVSERELSQASTERARSVLLDSIGCALGAHGDPTVARALDVARSLGLGAGAGDCTIIGQGLRAGLPVASFVNGVMIRVLDLNDVYAGPGQVGHPSDNIAVAIAATEKAGRSGKDLLRAIRLGYEIYGRIEDSFDSANTPWDHVSASGLTAAGMTGWLLGLPDDALGHALALAATHSATSREIRGGHVSSAKSIANGIVVQSATLLTLLAAEGMTGPSHALDGRYGFGKVVLDGADIDAVFAPGSRPDRVLSAGLKMYPCFAMAQGPIHATAAIRKGLGLPLPEVAKIRVTLADSAPARTRLADGASAMPTSHEQADHSIHFLVATALADGYVGREHFEGRRWQDPAIVELMARIEVDLDPALNAETVSAFPCRIAVDLADGRTLTEARPVAPGHPDDPLSWDDVKEKFTRNAAGVISDAACGQVVRLVEGIEDLPSIAPLLETLVP